MGGAPVTVSACLLLHPPPRTPVITGLDKCSSHLTGLPPLVLPHLIDPQLQWPRVTRSLWAWRRARVTQGCLEPEALGKW